MVMSREWTDWCLTPQGWQEGSSRIDSGMMAHKAQPDDCVLVIRYHEDVPALGARMSKYTEEVWRADGMDARISELIREYGKVPQMI